MQHNKLNIAFDQLPLEAFTLYGQGPVKGARRAASCVQPYPPYQPHLSL